MKVALVIWFAGQGVIYDHRDWDSCIKAMEALETVSIEATCHLDETKEEDRR